MIKMQQYMMKNGPSQMMMKPGTSQHGQQGMPHP